MTSFELVIKYERQLLLETACKPYKSSVLSGLLRANQCESSYALLRVANFPLRSISLVTVLSKVPNNHEKPW